MLQRLRLNEKDARTSTTLFSVGSVLHFASNGDHIWGTGRNGKISKSEHLCSSLNISAVRGPRTAEFLTSQGFDVPPVYGDPALLLPELYPIVRQWTQTKTRKLGIVPNLNETRFTGNDSNIIDPRGHVWDVIRAIAESEMVIGSSLHGIVIAEALGIPARLVAPSQEPAFKYNDYFEGTGRVDVESARDLKDALDMGSAPPLQWDSAPLYRAFPSELWGLKIDEAVKNGS